MDGRARRDRSFMVSLGLLIGGRIEGSLSNSLPISWISPGLSSPAGGAEGADVEGGSPGGGADDTVVLTVVPAEVLDHCLQHAGVVVDG